MLNDKGIAATNTLIGEAYLNGVGVEKDIVSARRWFEKGIAQSDPGCVFNMGYIYQKGIGETKNMKKGIMLMEQACDSSYLRACEYLGEFYYKGEDVDANVEETVRWYTQGTRLNGAKSHFYFSNYILLGYIDGDKSDALYNAKRAKELGYNAVACDFLVLKINGEMHE
jgi:TPR repeat protein